MGEIRDEDDDYGVGDWLGLIASTERDPRLRSMAERLLEAGPPPVPGQVTHSFVILDTDIGGDADDAIAVAVAAVTVPELALVVTCDEYGGHRARFARHLLDLLGRRDVGVVAGADLGNSRYFCVDGLVPGHVPGQPSGLEEAVEGVCVRGSLPVRWVGMGPMSNLARLARTRPDLLARLEVTQMGGALRYRDPTRAEHNFRLDPDAARRAIAAVRTPQLVISDTTFTPELAIDAASPLYTALGASAAPAWARLLHAHLDRWFEHFHPATIQHDALTLSAAMELPFVDLTRAHIALDEHARMRLDPDGIHVWISSRARHQPCLYWLTTKLTDAIVDIPAPPAHR